jgi:Kef-type K+ transport system membrane component KefB
MGVILAAATGETEGVILTLFLMLAAAKLFAELFERLRQPAVAGEILAGVLIGPSVLGLIAPTEITRVLAEIGVIFLLFNVGLETKPAAILLVGRKAAAVAILGVVGPFLGGSLLMAAWGGPRVEALFLGTAMVATSVGITARVLSSMGLLDAPSARIILGAAVIDDILGLIVLAIVSSTAAGTFDVIQIGTTAFLAISFTLFVTFVGAPVIKRAAPRVGRLRVGHSFFVFGLIVCLGLSAAATYVGVAAIIGAFLAGMALAEPTEAHPTMHRQTNGVTEFMVPFFLVNIGMQLDVSVFRDPSVIVLSIIVTLVAVATKFLACGVAALGLGPRRAAQVGMGMVPRGEVGIVVAQLGLSLAIISTQFYGIVLFMAIATTLIAPPFIKLLFASECAATEQIGPDDAGGILRDGEHCRIG